jgi:hypothetical protein
MYQSEYVVPCKWNREYAMIGLGCVSFSNVRQVVFLISLRFQGRIYVFLLMFHGHVNSARCL